MSVPNTYYKFESCCSDEVLYFQGPLYALDYFYTLSLPQVLIFDTAGIFPLGFDGLISGNCYLVTSVIGTCAPNAPCSFLPNGCMSITDYRTTCYVAGELYGECAPCPDCYLLMSCDGSPFFTTNQDLSAYLYSVTGQSVLLHTTDAPTPVCYQVVLAPPELLPCSSSTPPLYFDGYCTCDCICYSVIANAKDCYYIDCDGNFATTGILTGSASPAGNEVKFCSSVYPIIIGNVSNPFPNPYYITNTGDCIDGECPVLCYVLEDCDGILPDIHTNNTSLGAYAIIGSFITIVGYPDTCWEVIDTVECTCAINVSVINSYIDCPTCKGTPKYKLTNCDSLTTVIYTSTNLSAYVGEVIVILDCEGCWIVEEVDLIPSDVVITVDTSYIGCVECARTYYLLEDCSGYLPDAITYTDLSTYVGSVIKLEYCPETCWEVSITLDPTNAGEVIFIDQEYIDCDECLLTLPCICITVRNDSTTSKDYRYYDCILDVQYFTLLPGETSGKFCIRAWAIYFPETDYIESFGDCTQATIQDPWTCPPPIYPRRFIRPGYYVPACSIDKFEKITCKAAEAMYKKVLEQRYGISNCCPDDDNKWLIKKELIDLAGLVDPNYTCTPVQSCCNEAPNCGCTPLKTCNS
jgi:hypothetical protein